MFKSLRRSLAVGTAAAIALVGFGPAAPTSAAPAHLVAPAAANTTRALNRAAAWLVANPATADDGYAGRITSAMGLAVADTGSSAGRLRSRVASLKADAAAQSAASVGTALKLAILVEVMHQNPRNFGGANLVKTIHGGIHADGQVGEFASAYSQALAIIALKRAKETVPSRVVTKLLTFQDSRTGAFGYEWPVGVFNADPDSTALAIQALDLLNHRKYRTPIAKAVAWAKKNQTKAGYWQAYSPVNSTALMATALKQVGKSYGRARSWLLTQQLPGGGFPAELNGTDANLVASADATYLLKGTSMAKASYKLKGYSKSPRPKIVGTLRVGSTLTANVGVWSPKPSFTYQWYRSGKKITGATASTYTLVGKDQGKKIRVRVLAYGVGLKKHSEYSSYTAKVKKALVG